MHELPARRLLSLTLLLAVAGCAAEDKPRLYRASPVPPPGFVTTVTPALYNRVASLKDKVPITEDGIKSLQFMGPTLIEDSGGNPWGTNFAVYSQRAEKVQLLLFDDPESDSATRTIEMTRVGDVWNVFVEGIGLGQHFGYIAWGPNWTYDPAWYPGSAAGFVADVDFAGNRFNPNKLLFDPYCKAFNRDHSWAKGNLGTGSFRLDVTYDAAMKCMVVRSDYEWGDAETDYWRKRKDETFEGHRWNDLIIYEVHAKGFTANTASGAEHFGTYRGMGEKADYFKDLGVTAVELLPPFEKPLDGGYWGYNTLGFFAPELSYATRRRQQETIDEFKWMVEELHKRGIEVILDVVYNHSGEGGLWREKVYEHFGLRPSNLDPQDVASLYSFRGLDNASYYALPPDMSREYCDYTGVGNTMRCNAPQMKQLIIDSLRYWVEEFHVDGYRFDLAPALGGKDLQYDKCVTSRLKSDRNWNVAWDPLNTIIQEIIDDPIMVRNNVRIIAEPWGGGAYAVGHFPKNTSRPQLAWGEWNGAFRDWARGFVNNDRQGSQDPNARFGISPTPLTPEEQARNAQLKSEGKEEVPNINKNWNDDGGNRLTGSSQFFKHNERRPFHSINFVTVHDGFTLYDLVSYNHKVNGCSPVNPVCCDRPLSSFCDEAQNSGESHNRSRDWGSEEDKRTAMRNFFTLLLLAQGTPMIYGGDEWMRTQFGNNNTYTPEADNPYSWHDWGSWPSRDDRVRMHDFVKQMIKLRKDHAYAFAPTTFDSVPMAWRTPANTAMGTFDWREKSFMIHYPDKARGAPLAILINMGDSDVTFTLPPGRWKRLVDTQRYFDSVAYLNEKKLSLLLSSNVTLSAPVALPDNTYGVVKHSIVVLEAAD